MIRTLLRHVVAVASAVGVAVPLASGAEQEAGSTPVELPSVVVRDNGDALPAVESLRQQTEAGSRLGLTPHETPATIEIVTQDTMEARGLRNSTDIYRAFAGVTSGNIPGEPGMVSMRGFTSSATQYLFDGMRASDSAMLSRDFDSWNFERVEILKGPASVLHGTGALAGAINLVTRKPSFEGSIVEGLVGGGSFGSKRVGIGGNLKVNDAAALRADVSYSDTDGYVDDTRKRTAALTTGLALHPSDRLMLTLSLDYFGDRLGTPYQGLPLLPTGIARDPTSIVVTTNARVVDRSIRNTNYDVTDGVMNSDSYWLRTGAEFRLNEQWKLINELAYYDASRLWRNSEDFTFNATTGLLDRTTTRIDHSHKFWDERLYAAFDGTVAGWRDRLSVGVEFNHTDFSTTRRFGTTTSVGPFDPARGTFPSDTSINFPGTGSRVDFDSKVETSAVFVEDAINPAKDWTLVAGLRLDQIKLDRKVIDLNAGTTTPFGRDFESKSWRAGAIYDLNADVSVYGQYVVATAPITTLLLSNIVRAAFDLSTGRSVEAGVKSTFWQNRGVFTWSAYDTTQHDILTRDPNNPSITVQGGSIGAKGTEFDLSFMLTPQWQMGANAAFIRSEFAELVEAGGANRAGNRPPNVTNRVVNLGTSYRFAGMPVTIGASVRDTGDFYTNNANTIRVKGAAVLDAFVSCRIGAGTLALRGRNLTDRFYADWSGYSSTQVYIAAPRSFDVTWTARF